MKNEPLPASPYTCSICLGRGVVSEGSYPSLGAVWISNGMYEVCRSCNGDGIVWGPLSPAALRDLQKKMEG